MNSEGGAEGGKGLAVGTLSLRGPLNPAAPSYLLHKVLEQAAESDGHFHPRL